MIAGLFTYLSQFLTGIENKYEILERFFTGIAIYQGIIFICNKNFLDAEKDMALSYKTYLKYCKLYLETNSEVVFKIIEERLNELDTSNMFLNQNYKIAIRRVYDMIKNNNLSNFQKIIEVECEIINIEHLGEFEDLKWQQSLVLKLLK